MANSISEALRETARRYADAPAVRFPDRQVSFAALDRQSESIAAYLLGLGINRGDRIALYCPNSDAFAAIYTGILKAGAVVVPLNLLQTPNELAFVTQDAGVRGLFYHPLFAQQVVAFTAQLPSLEFKVVIAAEGESPNLMEILATAAPVAVEVAIEADDPAAILYTSGTTGRPKGAVLSHRNLLSNTRSVASVLEMRPGVETLLLVLPMFHAFAATVGMLTPLLHGFSFVPVPRFDPQLVTDWVEATGATIFLGVPSMYGVLSRLPDEQVARWRSVRFGVAGGAAMPVELIGRFEQRFGFPILEGDGPTECSPVTCVNPLNGVRKPGSVGLEVLDVEIRILDEAGNPLPIGEIGEICVRGPNVMKGYWNLPKETAETFSGDWLRTGDLGYKDEDGYIFMVDRVKDMVIVNGMNVYPRMIEEVLYRHPAVLEAAVVGEPNESHGEIPVAHLVLKEGAAPDSAALRNFCREHLAQYQMPRKFFFRDALPKNATGKILKRELRKLGELERGIDSRQDSE
ncbi:MAG: long-chain fatty acid--CoA ligase [Gammaproteobacteria bacterium RIFOXYA12_FULL_61_12]|nr:MAG: long-chain fatty acid--CoA ligase [Gammaproteobacteria bacterium RIFOXYA12_FULL_61_12]OGT88579.1 MAG: long-chain fatty acid--CoA ligase [Gammaproteobacteria bacterium RIFOXYD12_FULL_61_37]